VKQEELGTKEELFAVDLVTKHIIIN